MHTSHIEQMLTALDASAAVCIRSWDDLYQSVIHVNVTALAYKNPILHIIAATHSVAFAQALKELPAEDDCQEIAKRMNRLLVYGLRDNGITVVDPADIYMATPEGQAVGKEAEDILAKFVKSGAAGGSDA